MIRPHLWRLVARIVSRPAIANYLIQRAQRTPYTHIYGRHNNNLYMERWWLFNPYPAAGNYTRKGWRNWLPSIRVHHIVREDDDGHLHDHPWDARTIILKGWYVEEVRTFWLYLLRKRRQAGDTAPIRFEQYHRIDEVSDGGVWTLFFTWRHLGEWGFLVDGNKVPWRTYLGVEEEANG